ncbi:hypothetical protein TSUD_214140 [Trifolium subterraneum]|uniref:Uncharacterized protein n=1 Tax=Trifolium subterraneum TaxID=3900 RepID=A0A2Z6NK92_TRISU|nr:hypothetical protein TSUD_214140 [Trifolium subterraneum]
MNNNNNRKIWLVLQPLSSSNKNPEKTSNQRTETVRCSVDTQEIVEKAHLGDMDYVNYHDEEF